MWWRSEDSNVVLASLACSNEAVTLKFNIAVPNAAASAKAQALPTTVCNFMFKPSPFFPKISGAAVKNVQIKRLRNW